MKHEQSNLSPGTKARPFTCQLCSKQRESSFLPPRCPTVVYLQLKVEGSESLLAVVSLKQVFRAVLNTAADRLCDFHKHGTELTQSALDEFRSVQSGIQA